MLLHLQPHRLAHWCKNVQHPVERVKFISSRKIKLQISSPPPPPSPLDNAISVGVSMATNSGAIRLLKHSPFLGPKPTSTSLVTSAFRLPLSLRKFRGIRGFTGKKPRLTVCFVMGEGKLEQLMGRKVEEESLGGNSLEGLPLASSDRAAERFARRKAERFTYLVAAVMSSLGITSMAAMAVYYRFTWQMEGGEIPYSEILGTFSLAVGAAVGMEFWARWAHEALWHSSLWHMHESHHKPREGPFELNDVFAVVNALPAIALLSYGFFHKGLVPGLCFGAGLGITVFGIAYMFVHDGLVHRRFPVGPIANVPYFRRVASAHQLHHSEKFNGVPYGLFLGPKELEEVGGLEELEKEINRRNRLSKTS